MISAISTAGNIVKWKPVTRFFQPHGLWPGKRKRNGIYLRDVWAELTQLCRRKNSFKIIHLTKKTYDIGKLCVRYTFRRLDTEHLPSPWLKLRWIRMEWRNSDIKFKTSLGEDSAVREVDFARSRGIAHTDQRPHDGLVRLCTAGIQLKGAKYSDIQDLPSLPYMPEYHREYYRQLPYQSDNSATEAEFFPDKESV